MQILTELTPEFTLADVWQNENGGRQPRPSLLRVAEQLYPEAQTLISPAAVFDLFPVHKVTHDRIILRNGQFLRGPDVARLLAPAREIIVGVVTIGPALEERASSYFAEGASAHGYLLDCLGTAAVTNVVQLVCRHLEGLAEGRGYPLGFPVSPGDTGWPLTQQRVLFKLVNPDEIGVTLTASCAMLPKKSVSFIAGLGPGILTAAEASQCDYCSLRETCRYHYLHEEGGHFMTHA